MRLDEEVAAYRLVLKGWTATTPLATSADEEPRSRSSPQFVELLEEDGFEVAVPLRRESYREPLPSIAVSDLNL